MSALILLAQAAAVVAPAPPALPAPPPAAAAGQQGVTSYEPAFFASAQPANALEMVQRLPGFALDLGDAVRGFEGAAGNVLINGKRPTAKSDGLDAILQRIQVSQVARIDIIHGGAPGIDMQGKSMLANVILKTDGGFHGLFAVASNYVPTDGRVAPSVRIEGSGGANGRTWELGLRSGKAIDDGSGNGLEVQIDRAGQIIARSQLWEKGDGLQHTLTGAYETPLAGGSFRINGRLYANYYDYREVDSFSLPPDQSTATHDSDDEVDTELGARWSRDFGPRANLELVGLSQTKDETFQEVFDQTPGDDSHFKLLRRSGENIARAVLKYRQSDHLSFEVGGEGAFNKLTSETRLVDDGATVDLPAANVKVEETRGEAFVKAVWRPAAAWTVEAVVRQEGSHVSATGDVALGKSLYYTKPRLAVSWDVRRSTQLRARVERVVGQLSFDDFVASASLNRGQLIAGNPNLNPEQAWVSEAEIEQHFWTGGAAVLTFRHSDLTDTVDYAPVFVGGDYFERRDNIGKGHKDEILASLTIPLDKLGLKNAQLRGQGTWRLSQVTDPIVRDQREISALRPLEWEAHFTRDLPRWHANWGVDVCCGWRETRYHTDYIETRKLKPWVSPFVEWKPRRDIAWRFEVDNATARGFRYAAYHYDGSRSPQSYAYLDDRDPHMGRIYYVRLRKTFGG